jgi:hypothetical protein
MLRARKSDARTPVGARDLSLIQNAQTDPGTHPASHTMVTGSLPGVKRPKRGDDHQPHLEQKLKKQ